MASRKKQPSKKKDGIHFVNARPASETEKLKAQRLVRAHVGRWISDQTKERSAGESSNSRPHPPRDYLHPLPVLDRAGPGPAFALASRPSSSHLASIPASSLAFVHESPSRQLAYRDSPFPQSQASESSESSGSDDASTVAGASSAQRAIVQFNDRPVERLERNFVGAFDPFVTYPTPMNFEPTLIHLSEHYLRNTVWPGLAPRPNSASTAADKWLHLSMDDSALFTAFMFGSLCHLRVQCQNDWIPRTSFGRREQHALQLCEMESIKLINQAIRDPKRVVEDGVLLSVICMAHHQAEENSAQHHEKTPFNPPFPRLQWINVYGCLPPNMIHIKGLLQLVKLRGGLTTISTEGLAATISFSDILTCSVLSVRPCFDFWPLADERRGMSIQELLGFSSLAFDERFGRLQGVGATRQMIEAFQAVHAYIGITKSPNPTRDISLLADQRNLTQHTLLSLPPASRLDIYVSQSTQATTYEALRLAALVFGVGVIFPIPAQNTPLSTLAREIRLVLLQSSSSVLWSSPSTRFALLWILTLGGIAAHDTPERTWFVSVLGDISRRTKLSSWASVKPIVTSMLWLDTACDRAAEALWLESTSKYSFVIG
ncbi:hypothetical protein N7457_003835 [Penicillium paradoxum]|uniref:uncharacterized protein n=1 Tax=Penicillium paradoxum TaxID=176176 RepID=UPI002547945F|nr:uncharacterized protein N7457_003835 [Penicillium paradoxum]KAJ5782061.1 hypothetical protein N7457_003835 [Penicillium paradoxum]